ncbi:MAG: YggS family pyridoxal phosphate-dependent enzyme [Armatimonadota bacterium]|jgi:pyridoxal phosphate enzyme (YggS family)
MSPAQAFATPTSTDIRANLEAIRERIARAAERAGRNPDDVTLVGASKKVPVERIELALEAGLRHIGENFVQEATPKHDIIGARATWHFIGHLQRNKVKYVLPRFDVIESVDSRRLAREISKRATQAQRQMRVLMQVNVGDETTKFGVAPEQSHELAATMAGLEGLALSGLMAMPPMEADPEDSRRYFVALRELRDAIEGSHPGMKLPHLSMGMTHDFEVAVQEGATIVRVGTGIFGPRPTP